LPSTTFDLTPVPPFRLDLTVWALRRRRDNAIDGWDGTTYRRVLVVGATPLIVTVNQVERPDMPRLRVRVDGPTATSEVSPALIVVLERLLGLRVDLTAFYQLAAGDPRLGHLAERFRGVKPPRFPTSFEALLNAIACQQITLTQGIRLLNRLAEAHGPVGPDDVPTIRALPGPDDLASLDPEALRGLGFSHQKARALVEVSRAILDGRIDLDTLANLNDLAAVVRLRELRGVGRWSAEYVLLRGLGRIHIFPGDDVGARKNLHRWLGLPSALDYAGVQRAVAGWYPYAGLVYFHLLLDRLAALGYLSEQDERDPSQTTGFHSA
jgi:DNA-3-methyladenine glycosylase II